jgi:nicotinic acid phosphoribosyltransferase
MNLFQAVRLTWQEMRRSPAQLQRSLQEESVEHEAIPDATGNAGIDEYQDIPVLPTVPHATLMRFVEENQTNVYKYFYNSIKSAIKANSNEAVLFRLGTSKMLLRIHKNEFANTLETMSKHFLKVEEYEMIPKCRKLLDKHYINQVIEN